MFMIQHGNGKSVKMDRCIESAPVSGAILSTIGENRDPFFETVGSLQSSGLSALIDPMAFLYSLVRVSPRPKHQALGIEFMELSPTVRPSRLVEYVRRVGELNDHANINGPRIAPGIAFSGVEDPCFSLSMQMLEEAADQWGESRTVATLVTREELFDRPKEVAKIVDIVTAAELTGIYLIVPRTEAYQSPWRPNHLVGVLELIQTLAGPNQLPVYWGYSDVTGLLGVAAGAAAGATGWNNSQRHFTLKQWIPSRGGQPATPRFFSRDLMLSLIADSEMAPIASSIRSELQKSTGLSEFDADSSYLTSPVRSTLQTQHMVALAEAYADLSSVSENDRLEYLEGVFSSAIGLVDLIVTKGILDAASMRRYERTLDSYLQAIKTFRGRSSL